LNFNIIVAFFVTVVVVVVVVAASVSTSLSSLCDHDGIASALKIA
jgi:hypothetical protein